MINFEFVLRLITKIDFTSEEIHRFLNPVIGIRAWNHINWKKTLVYSNPARTEDFGGTRMKS
jgi:hypothetical protein